MADEKAVSQLEELRKVFHKWFEYEDETLLDLCLAVKIHSLQLWKYQVPIWLFIVGSSGDRKSSTIMALLDDYELDERRTYFLNYLTQNTLATGAKGEVENDLAPKLRYKLVITGDMAQFISLDPKVKNAVWSQLREAFEGRVQKDTGSGVHTCYTGNYFDWLAASTPIIDEELILKNQLGTRELIYRMPKEATKEEDRKKLMDAVWHNTDAKMQRDKELKDAVRKFFFKWQQPSDIPISEASQKKLYDYAFFITQLRVTAECDWRQGDLINFVYPEKPTRILEQLKMLFVCLKSIDSSYTDDDALKRIFEIVKSSIHPVRLKILQIVNETWNLSTTKIAQTVGLAYATTNRELQVCKQLEILVKTEIAADSPNENPTYAWYMNATHPIFKVLKDFD